MAAAPSSDMSDEVDWSFWDGRGLQSKFKGYNEKFNPSQETDKMMFPSWKNFTGNMKFKFISDDEDLFKVFHDCGSGVEGEETLNYAQFKTAIGRLFKLENVRRHPEANEDQLVTQLDLDEILAPVIHSPVKRRPIKWPHKSFFTFFSRHEETASKIASEFGTTLRAMADAGKELNDIGISAPYAGMCCTLLKKIGEYKEAYEKSPDELVKFAKMLTFVFEVLAIIKEEYSNETLKNRLKGLELILQKSNVLLEKAEKKCQKGGTKFLSAKDFTEKMKKRAGEIRDWMNEISPVQLAETHQEMKDIHKDVGEIKKSNKDIKQKIQQSHEDTQQGVQDILTKVTETHNLMKNAWWTKGPRGAGGGRHETIPSQVQQNPRPPQNIQPEDEGATPTFNLHPDHGEGGPASYCIQDSPMTSSREEESMQRMPAGPVVRPPRRNQANLPSPLTSRTPTSGLQSDDSPTSRRNIRQNGVEPSERGQGEHGRMTPTAPPESLPHISDQSAPESQPAATPPEAPTESATRPPPETPPPNTASSDELILTEDKTIVDVLQWVSDNFGITDFSFFARALPGQSRLTTKDIQNATYPLHRDHSLSERNMAILEYWQEGNPDQCNITTIHKKLIDCRKNELARKLRREFTNQ